MKTEPTEALSWIERRKSLNNHVFTVLLSESETGCRLAFQEGQSSPKIKQLEWDFYGTYYTTSRMEYRIETPFIDCMITQGDGFNIYEDECLLWIDGVSYNFRTLDEAKAAAQAEFEKRVMECLDL